MTVAFGLDARGLEDSESESHCSHGAYSEVAEAKAGFFLRGGEALRSTRSLGVSRVTHRDARKPGSSVKIYTYINVQMRILKNISLSYTSLVYSYIISILGIQIIQALLPFPWFPWVPWVPCSRSQRAPVIAPPPPPTAASSERSRGSPARWPGLWWYSR